MQQTLQKKQTLEKKPKKTTNFLVAPCRWKKLKRVRTAYNQSPRQSYIRILLTMPVTTRSQTRLQQERNDAYARMRAINARNTHAVGVWDKYRTAGDQIAFILENPHINVFLAEDRLFRRETYVKCYQLLQSPHCTRNIAIKCKMLRSQIREIGLYA